MANKKNKVKFNIRNVHYALLTKSDDGEVTYGTPVPMPGAVSISLDPNGEPSVFYADGYAYYTINNNKGYEGDLEDATVETGKFALLFEFDGDINKIRHVLYNCTAARPTIESATKEDEIEVKTETLSITASPLDGGYVKARTSDSTSAAAYDGWYKTVYLPKAVSDASGQSDSTKVSSAKNSSKEVVS